LKFLTEKPVTTITRHVEINEGDINALVIVGVYLELLIAVSVVNIQK
jgi:hypothetical protein